ncbi:hypothetical protein FQK02_09705 [Xanthomonas vasicola]|uniref:Uncharacterized protein n=1 Tax=Xanthomonas vasicola pv. vasculorum NCPPB 890 TaxID=1184265 RepID=A0A837B5L3_XANVA|nr:hypothetical protein [Xanthomonas vasicola]KFA30034.1 hypothetical protein KW5_0105845 [Xanthomonas vasicola pv. vasculorum NCPPB 1326]MBV6748619.1 hypothetical protein [Xanthomonas vasicola pv. vasculorum NCPPB 890]MBV6894286.1 hypothetical protein [Xanthomonas vasicola pv. vasculorum]MDO6950174.1 hypothetical protein [Xanthomonas vasicola]MDO6962241.1 hypothetical protein [Xanthomonas vasicola]
MTNVSTAESFEEGFFRAALEVIAKRDERNAIIASRDFDGLRQRLDRSASTTHFTQPMAEFYLGIPRRQFDKLKREHGNPFAVSKSTPRSITKAELLTWYAQVTKAREQIQEPISGKFGRTGKGIPFIVIRESAGKIKSVISHAGITGLDMSAIEEAFQKGATILALTIDHALVLPWQSNAEKRLWRNAYRSHLMTVHAAKMAWLDRQELDEDTKPV